MCRFTLYLGPPVRLSTLLTEPEHSLIMQSFHATEREEPLNGDGFGVGWYAPRLSEVPGVFREVTPAWSSQGLLSIAQAVASPCVMAHVRAATPGSGVGLTNCHPFGHGRYLLMHNGMVGAFREVRRPLLESLSNAAFDVVRGSTDSEHLFAVFLDEVFRREEQPAHADDVGAMGLATRLSAAMTRVLDLVREADEGAACTLNVAVTDGAHVAVCRFDSQRDRHSESLYLLHGEMYEPAGRAFAQQRRAGEEGEAMVVASERLTDDERWQQVPRNHMLLLDRESPPRLLAMDLRGVLQR